MFRPGMRCFERYVGIDYSGAQIPTSSLKGLRIYSASPTQAPVEIAPPAGRRKYWSRRGIAEWLVGEIKNGPSTLVGIDHAFSFPQRYFERHQLPSDWSAFLDDFQLHWPTDRDHFSVDSIRDGSHGAGAERAGNSRWRRMCEERCRAKSVFHFDVQGSVAKSTHGGLPWLRFLRRELGDRVHFWPFDGWTPPPQRTVIGEVYPSLWNKSYSVENRSPDQHDAYSVARWMQARDSEGTLASFFQPKLDRSDRLIASMEGWILGLP